MSFGLATHILCRVLAFGFLDGLVSPSLSASGLSKPQTMNKELNAKLTHASGPLPAIDCNKSTQQVLPPIQRQGGGGRHGKSSAMVDLTKETLLPRIPTDCNNPPLPDGSGHQRNILSLPVLINVLSPCLIIESCLHRQLLHFKTYHVRGP